MTKNTPCSNFHCPLHATCGQYSSEATTCYLPDLSEGQGCSRYKVQAESYKLISLDVFQNFCQSEGLPIPLKEVRTIPGRLFRTDYFFQKGDKKVALEIEGGVWKGGGHTSGVGFTKDVEKYNAYAEEGIYLYRAVPRTFVSMKTVNAIKSLLK
jgi:hypothetical protein